MMFEIGMYVWHRSQQITLTTKPFQVSYREQYVGHEPTYIICHGNISLCCAESDLTFARLGPRAC